MKKIFLSLMVIILAACNNNVPNTRTVNAKGEKHYNILCKEKSPYLEWYINGGESYVQYSFSQYPFSVAPEVSMYQRETEDNTIMLNEKVGIRIHDSCCVENIGENTIYNIHRTAQLLHTNFTMYDSLTVEIHSGSPLEIIRPRAEECNCIPLCYYDQMEIEWSADVVNQEINEKGVVVVAEWNGLTMTGQTGSGPIIGIDFVDNTDEDCISILDNNIFEGMPDEALVNLWIIRGSIYTLYYNEENITLSELIEIANYEDTEIIIRYMQEHPEFMRVLRNLTVGSAAIAVQPIYLIRNL